MIPIHPEATDDPQTLRWIVPVDTVEGVGEVTDAPGEVGAMLREGVLTRVIVEPAAILVTLADRHTWRAMGAAVRDALADALEEPGQWRTAHGDDPDARLRAAVEMVLESDVGDYVRSHGGSIEIESAHDEQVALLLRGTCAGCPAAGITLHERIETELRRVHPSLRSITARDDHELGSGPRWLTIGRRR